MNSQRNHNFSLSRRDFIWAAFACPLLISLMLSNGKNEKIKPFPSNKDKDFIILAGWVLLNDDLLDNLG